MLGGDNHAVINIDSNHNWLAVLSLMDIDTQISVCWLEVVVMEMSVEGVVHSCLEGGNMATTQLGHSSMNVVEEIAILQLLDKTAWVIILCMC